MGCGCKKKKPIQPEQQPARITYVEDGQLKSKPMPPEPVQPPPPPPQVLDPSEIVNRLNRISVPQ